ncbi:unnamed protein product [Periconia digitata]|uniref:Uncharacterized protein n=1 Tax=Periconia digitata TaxID=1303443 RepID=A0A9W4XQS3_9PLEO|nr:unnamed protein product [Periconia digitata]
MTYIYRAVPYTNAGNADLELCSLTAPQLRNTHLYTYISILIVPSIKFHQNYSIRPGEANFH